MEFFFYAVPAFIAAVVVAMAVKVVRRFWELRRAWSSGLTAEARCLRTFTTTSGGHGDGHATTTLHHVYEFTSPAGPPVRFEEENGPATTVEGDFVTVHYPADRPHRATAHAPSPARSAASMIALLLFFGVVLAFCVFFVLTANDMSGTDLP
ncbi:DUF3592 domain-containing protein [Streptomyces sp. NPDC008313]|uniref:DUF3592 domain-containing protein n=1 Tax=Streptomyces sp. NPDC008313 TaxID=3364826 RepID=UPI0036E7F501